MDLGPQLSNPKNKEKRGIEETNRCNPPTASIWDRRSDSHTDSWTKICGGNPPLVKSCVPYRDFIIITQGEGISHVLPVCNCCNEVPLPSQSSQLSAREWSYNSHTSDEPTFLELRTPHIWRFRDLTVSHKLDKYAFPSYPTLWKITCYISVQMKNTVRLISSI